MQFLFPNPVLYAIRIHEFLFDTEVDFDTNANHCTSASLIHTWTFIWNGKQIFANLASIYIIADTWHHKQDENVISTPWKDIETLTLMLLILYLHSKSHMHVKCSHTYMQWKQTKSRGSKISKFSPNLICTASWLEEKQWNSSSFSQAYPAQVRGKCIPNLLATLIHLSFENRKLLLLQALHIVIRQRLATLH